MYHLDNHKVWSHSEWRKWQGAAGRKNGETNKRKTEGNLRKIHSEEEKQITSPPFLPTFYLMPGIGFRELQNWDVLNKCEEEKRRKMPEMWKFFWKMLEVNHHALSQEQYQAFPPPTFVMRRMGRGWGHRPCSPPGCDLYCLLTEKMGVEKQSYTTFSEAIKFFWKMDSSTYMFIWSQI